MIGPDDARRVLVVVAHPDDETFGTGSLLLRLADRGVTTGVCCASRGEAGDVREGVPVPAGGVAALREAELRCAADALGVSEVFLLDLLDSGMTGTAPADSIAGAPMYDVTRRVSDAVAAFGPDLLVTLDGGDGHRDHVRVRDAAVSAGCEHGIPVWLHCLPRGLMRRWAQSLAGQDPDSPYLALGELGTPDEQITTRIDTGEFYDRRWEAIALHRSQVSPYEALPQDLQRAFLATEHLHPAPLPADPDSARHQHNRHTCYWDHLAGRWSCGHAHRTTSTQPVS